MSIEDDIRRDVVVYHYPTRDYYDVVKIDFSSMKLKLKSSCGTIFDECMTNVRFAHKIESEFAKEKVKNVCLALNETMISLGLETNVKSLIINDFSAKLFKVFEEERIKEDKIKNK